LFEKESVKKKKKDREARKKLLGEITPSLQKKKLEGKEDA